MQNILFYLHNYPGYGGIEIVTTKLANYFAEKGKCVYIYSFKRANTAELLKDLNEHVTFVPAKDENHFAEMNLDQFLFLLNKHKIELVIFQDSYKPIEDMLINARKSYDFKIWIVEHNTPNCRMLAFENFVTDKLYYKIKHFVFGPFYKKKIIRNYRQRILKLYNTFDKYILLSKRFIPVWEKMVGLSNHNKLTFISNPITIDIPSNSDFPKEKVCLFCGRLVTQKGIDKLVRIWEKIEKTMPNWKLYIVGDGPERTKVEKYIVDKKLNNIYLEGFQKNTKKYYEKASILCMTSIYEGWPLILGEAMAYGCVPIMFNSYAAAEDIIQDGVDGFLIKPFNEEEYAERLFNLMDDSSLLKSMSQCAINSSQKFEIEKIGEEWIKMM